MLAVNLTGTFNVTRLAVPYVRRPESGVVIMSSLAGTVGYPNRSLYSVNKWCLVGFTKTLSMEYGDDAIRMNAIQPEAVEGPHIRKVLEGGAQASGKPVQEVEADALATQSIKAFVDPMRRPVPSRRRQPRPSGLRRRRPG